MAATSALHTAGAVTSAPAARLAQTALVAKYGLTPRTGVVYAGVQTLLTATATMQVQVSPLHFVGSKADAQGTYWGANDGAYLLTIAAPPGAGSRTDKVYIMQQDSNAGTTSPDATTAPLIAATSGSLPAGAVQIGTVTVPAGIAALTDAGVVIATTCQWTAAAGAPIPVRNTTERAALTAYTGLQVLRLDKGGLVQTYDGSSWRGVRRHTATFSSVDVNRSDATGIQTGITHGCGFTPAGAAGASQSIALQWRVFNFTSTTFDLQVVNSDGSANGTSTFDYSLDFFEALT